MVKNGHDHPYDQIFFCGEAMDFFDKINTTDRIMSPWSSASLDADRKIDEGECEYVFNCSYCFKNQPYVEDPHCVHCAMDMSKYKPGVMAPLIINFIMQYD